ncbi:radical SAM protein [bacterium]|nr:radical SAM protein [bacterium]
MAANGETTRLTLILTTHCNMNCSYCYQSVREPRSMEWSVAEAAVDLALSAPGNRAEFTFYGGEPLLEFDLMRRAVKHAEAGRQPDERVKYWVVTNGTLITDEIADFLAEHDFKLLLSFDGVRAAQNFRGEGSFETLDRVLDSLRERHPDYFRRAVEISVTVSPLAVRFLADSVDYLLGKGVQEIDLTPVMTPSPGWDDDCLLELEAQFGRVLRSSLAHLEQTGEVPLLLYAGKGKLSGPQVTSRAMCEIVDSNSWAIDVDGRVSGCTLFAASIQEFGSPLLSECRPVLSLGHVTDADLLAKCESFHDAVRRLPIFSEKEKKYSSYRRCADCRFFAACVTCPASIGFAEGNTDPHRVPDYYCAFNYTAFASRDGFPVQPTDIEVIRGDRYRELRLKWKAIGEEARRGAGERAGASGSSDSGRPLE